MTDAEKIDKAKALLGGRLIESANPALRRVFLTVAPADLRASLEALKTGLDQWFLATITGVDAGDVYEVLYHFGDTAGSITVRTSIPKAAPHLPSICAVIPGAILYERELQDMFGIVVDDIPDPRNLLMPDGWPEGNFPLRKDWTYERPKEIIPGGKA
ncbi:MAG: NADH-quinone oxidoreductase subunit C [Acidobacteriota bacterium]|nr:NADH-quinone oxidoreductase subunit C [Acidobacteriota bacterium]